MSESAVTVGGNYVEDENFVPNAADLQKTFNTSGLGASGRIEETSSVFEVDKVKTAEQIVAALDEDDDTVDSSKVLLPETTTDNDTAKEQVLSAAKARVEQGAVVNGPTPAEREAEEEGQEVRAESNASTAETTTGSTGEPGDVGGDKGTKKSASSKSSGGSSGSSKKDEQA